MKKESRKNIENRNNAILKTENGDVFVNQIDYEVCMLCGGVVTFDEMIDEIDDKDCIKLEYSCISCKSNVTVEFRVGYIQIIIAEDTINDYDDKDKRRAELHKVIADAQNELYYLDN